MDIEQKRNEAIELYRGGRYEEASIIYRDLGDLGAAERCSKQATKKARSISGYRSKVLVIVVLLVIGLVLVLRYKPSGSETSDESGTDSEAFTTGEREAGNSDGSRDDSDGSRDDSDGSRDDSDGSRGDSDGSHDGESSDVRYLDEIKRLREQLKKTASERDTAQAKNKKLVAQLAESESTPADGVPTQCIPRSSLSKAKRNAKQCERDRDEAEEAQSAAESQRDRFKSERDFLKTELKNSKARCEAGMQVFRTCFRMCEIDDKACAKKCEKKALR